MQEDIQNTAYEEKYKLRKDVVCKIGSLDHRNTTTTWGGAADTLLADMQVDFKVADPQAIRDNSESKHTTRELCELVSSSISDIQNDAQRTITNTSSETYFVGFESFDDPFDDVRLFFTSTASSSPSSAGFVLVDLLTPDMLVLL